MYYYQYVDENSTTFYELYNEYYCLRSLLITPPNIINTNLTIENRDFFLAEGCFHNALDELTAITQQTFAHFWKQSITPHLAAWQQLKSDFKIGQKLQAQIVCFYPQGVIVKYGKTFFGLADYQECLSVLDTKQMYPSQKIDLYIQQFDDDNLWIHFSVHPITIPNNSLLPHQ